MNKTKFFTALLSIVFALTGCVNNRAVCNHVDKNSDYKCDKCGADLPYVKSLKISNPPFDMDLNESVQLSAEIVALNGASSEFTWSVDDESLASISGTGLLTSKKTGTVTVTAKSNHDQTVYDSVQIKVINKGFNKNIYEAGYNFDESFPEEVVKQFLGSQKIFVPSSSFTEKGTYYLQNQENTALTVVYGVDFNDDTLDLLYEEMYYCDDLFYLDSDESLYTFGCKNDLYTVSLSFKTFGETMYLINVYYKNSALYKDTKLTENTNWTDEDRIVIGDRLPFFKMGEGYKAEYFPESESDVERIIISDNYAKYNLKEDIVKVLLENGFYYVPTEDNYQKPSDDYNLYAYTVEFSFYYGTQVRLTKGQCASKTFQSDLVQYAVLDAIDFQGEIFNMDLSTKEILGEEIAPEYRATLTDYYVSISGIYANLDEFFELENKYLGAGYKIVEVKGDDSWISIELVYIRLTVIIELYAQTILDESSFEMYHDFDYSTLRLTFAFTDFSEFPSFVVSQFFAGQTNVEVPPLEGSLFYNVITSDDYLFILAVYEDVYAMSDSYYYWVQTLINDGWVIDEIDYVLSGGNYLIGCFKDNLFVNVGFMTDASGYLFIDLEICLFEPEYPLHSSETWPEKDIETISLGRTEVELPGIDDPDKMSSYGFMQTSALEYSIFGYGLYTAEDYAGMLEEAGFVGEYDEDNSCFVYTKGNLTVKVYQGMYHFRVDVTITLE